MAGAVRLTSGQRILRARIRLAICACIISAASCARSKPGTAVFIEGDTWPQWHQFNTLSIKSNTTRIYTRIIVSLFLHRHLRMVAALTKAKPSRNARRPVTLLCSLVVEEWLGGHAMTEPPCCATANPVAATSFVRVGACICAQQTMKKMRHL